MTVERAPNSGAGGRVADVLEVNVAPGMTSTSTLPIAMRAAGMNTGACGLALLEQAVERAQGA